MSYIFKVNGNSWGRIIRSNAQINYDFDTQDVVDDLIISFHKSVDYKDIMDMSRSMIAEIDTYVLTIEDEDENVIYTSDDYVRLIKSETIIEEGNDEITCTITWSRV